MSSKQLARTVVDGRRIILRIPGLRGELVGYLCGMDDFHLFVITPEGEKHLVHKGSVAVATLAEEKQYDTEPHRELLERVVGPFRLAVQKNHLAPAISIRRERHPVP